MKRRYLSLAISLFMAMAPVAAQGGAPADRAQSKNTAVALKPEQQKLRGVPLWLLLGGLGTAAIILAASNHGKHNTQAQKAN